MAGQRNSDIGVRFVSDEVKRDHRDLETLLAALLQTYDDHDVVDKASTKNDNDNLASTREKLQDRFCWGLVRHLVAMQLFVFPGTDSRAKEGSLAAGDRQRDSWEIRDQLIAFSRLAPSSADHHDDHDAQFRAAAARMAAFLRAHVHQVERADMVAIERALDGDESERMARDWARVNVLVPPRVRRSTDNSNGGDRLAKGGDAEEGQRDKEKNAEEEEKESPYATVEEILSAPLEDVRKVWERLVDR